MRFKRNSEVEIVKIFYRLKAANHNLKHILVLGGAVDSADGDKYSRMVSSAQSRKSFVQQSAEFLKKYHFDGLGKNFEFLIRILYYCIKSDN
jgi:GH18 family chitinase